MQFSTDIKIIWRYLRPFKSTARIILFLATIGAVLNAVIPLLYGRLVDMAINRSDWRLIAGFIVAWFVLSLISDALARGTDQLGDALSVRVSNSVLNFFMTHFIRLPISFHKNQKMGKLFSRMERAAYDLESIVADAIFSTAPGFLTAIVILVILFFVHWLLAVILLAVLVLYIAATVWRTGAIIVAQRQMHKIYDRAFGDFWEDMTNVQPIKAFAAEKFIGRKLERHLRRISVGRLVTQGSWRTLSFYQQTIFGVGFVLLFSLGTMLLFNGKITAGSLVTFVGYISLVYRPLSQLAFNYQKTRRCLVAFGHLEKIRAMKTEIETRGEITKRFSSLRGAVSFQRVWFHYDGADQPWVLRDISFDVVPGESIAFVGESGGGKSTMADLIASFYLPTKGKIEIDGTSVRNIDGENLRRFVGIVPQEVALFHETIWYNLRFGNPSATGEAVMAAAKAANAHEFIMKFPRGYDSKVGERGVKLSVGQKQRIAIARAMLHDPAILILDEATASMDSITEKAVQEALQKLIVGRTTFVIAHRLSTVKQANRIFVLDQGKLVEAGTHQELINHDGVYKKLYLAQKF